MESFKKKLIMGCFESGFQQTTYLIRPISLECILMWRIEINQKNNK